MDPTSLIAALVACLVGFLVVSSVYGFYLGLANKAVFYYNRTDLTISSLPLLTIVITIFATFIVHAVWNNALQTEVIWFLGAACTAFLYGLTGMNAYRYNRGSMKKAIPISIAKVTMGFIALFGLSSSGQRPKNTSQQITETFVYAGKVALFAWLYSKLINGNEVLTEDQSI
jgi:hypothetical protein